MSKKLHYKDMNTLVSHYAEFEDPENAHVTPIYQTSTFGFTDAASGAAIAAGQGTGYYYTRLGNPNFTQLARKLAALEAWDFLQQDPESDPEQLAAGMIFASGMAALTGAILSVAKTGQTIITQKALYDGTYIFFNELAPRYGFNVVWVDGSRLEEWQAAFSDNPNACLAYVETPVNPAMGMVDVAAVSGITHLHGAKVIVDNTFATPFCQRPLSLGADVVVHSTTKYISGHGHLIGGAVIAKDLDWVKTDLKKTSKILGAVPSPFDTWLANIGLKTFPLRMKRHCENALTLARFLEDHPSVKCVHYPGLESHPQHELAKRQMHQYGGMLSFELEGGLEAGEHMMNSIRVCRLAVSLGNVDTLIQHPASMTHRNTPRELRLAAGITDGLVRLSVGIEDVEDLMEDISQAMQ